MQQIKTTTLSSEDFFQREDTCQNKIIEVLFTGRLDPLKGIYELIESVAELINLKYSIRLNIVGWEFEKNKPVEKELRRRVTRLKIVDDVTFHGRKSIGSELNAIYRFSDIYVLPSHEEGFPRTIWEAMANSLPVITTDVGGIPSFLTHEENVIMIKPKKVEEITKAIKKVISEKELRMRLISNGQKIARENTLEKQTKIMVDIVKKLINE